MECTFGNSANFILPETQKNLYVLEKNPFASKLFAGQMECGVDNSFKNVSPRNRQLLAHCPKVKKNWFLPNFSLELLRYDGHVERLPGSSSFSLKFLRTQRLHTRHHWRILFLRTWKFSAKIQEKYYNWFFLKKSSIYSKSCSAHMECSFGNSAKIILPETQNILAQCPKVRKVLFLPEICPLECSTGREEFLTDELAVFLQISVSSGKPLQNIKLYLLPKKMFWIFSSGHMDFVFDTLVENFCRKSGISSFKIRKECQTYIF